MKAITAVVIAIRKVSISISIQLRYARPSTAALRDCSLRYASNFELPPADSQALLTGCRCLGGSRRRIPTAGLASPPWLLLSPPAAIPSNSCDRNEIGQY